MKFKKELEATIDSRGRLVLPAEFVSRYGLKPGDTIALREQLNSFQVRQPINLLKKVYIEPTSLCNLTCRTCIRNIWNEPTGHMSTATFDHIIIGLRTLPSPPTVVFGGFGEPLSHPHIIEMVKKVKALGLAVELITNGTLLIENVARALLSTKLDVLWLSLDGASAESYADVRPGAVLPEVLANVTRLRYSSWAYQYHQPHLGIVFVAMKRNIADLPEVLRIGARLKADRFVITNVLPYTEELLDEVLYDRALGDNACVTSQWAPHLNFSKIDMNETTRDSLYRVMRGWRLSSHAWDDAGERNYCRFIEGGSTAISWDGNVSPCLPLMHSHTSYLHDRLRTTQRHVIGNIGERSLVELWNDTGYGALRKRVQAFDFSPCTFCGGCEMSEANEKDCFGNTLPTCGGCLWAQGVIQCP
jgi:MoaA/NifB/PqqE/SkfB family radical SAM enzyme